jgi:hypothetical protein
MGKLRGTMDMVCPENRAGIPEDCDVFNNPWEFEPIDHVKRFPYSRLREVQGVLAGSAIPKRPLRNSHCETGIG